MIRTFTVFPADSAAVETLVHVVAELPEMVHVLALATPSTITVNA